MLLLLWQRGHLYSFHASSFELRDRGEEKKKNVQRRERRRGGEHGAAMLFPRLNVDLIKRVQPFEGAAHFLEMHIL